MRGYRFLVVMLGLMIVFLLAPAADIKAEQQWGDPKPVNAPGNPTAIDYSAVRDGKRPQYPGWGSIFKDGKNPYMRRWEDTITLKTTG